MSWLKRRRISLRGGALARASRAIIEQLENRKLLTVNFNAPTWIEQGPSIVKGDIADETAGAVTTIAAPINNADVAFVGTTNGGAFLGDFLTGTPRWTQLTSTFASQSIGALELSRFIPADGGGFVKITKDTVASTTKMTLYMGFNQTSSSEGFGGPLLGLFKSTNGGVSWKPIGGNTINAFKGKQIRAIAESEDDPDVVMVDWTGGPVCLTNATW